MGKCDGYSPGCGLLYVEFSATHEVPCVVPMVFLKTSDEEKLGEKVEHKIVNLNRRFRNHKILGFQFSFWVVSKYLSRNIEETRDRGEGSNLYKLIILIIEIVNEEYRDLQPMHRTSYVPQRHDVYSKMNAPLLLTGPWQVGIEISWAPNCIT